MAGLEFRFCEMREFWRWQVVTASQHATCSVPLTCTLKDGEYGAFCGMCILAQFFKLRKKRERNSLNTEILSYGISIVPSEPKAAT